MRPIPQTFSYHGEYTRFALTFEGKSLAIYAREDGLVELCYDDKQRVFNRIYAPRYFSSYDQFVNDLDACFVFFRENAPISYDEKRPHFEQLHQRLHQYGTPLILQKPAHPTPHALHREWQSTRDRRDFDMPPARPPLRLV